MIVEITISKNRLIVHRNSHCKWLTECFSGSQNEESVKTIIFVKYPFQFTMILNFILNGKSVETERFSL
jgi:hypothetical protein